MNITFSSCPDIQNLRNKVIQAHEALNLAAALSNLISNQCSCFQLSDNLSGSCLNGSFLPLVLNCFHLHLIGFCTFARKDVLTLKIGINHENCRGIIIHFPDDNRHCFFPCKHGSISASMAGDHFIFAILQRSDDCRKPARRNRHGAPNKTGNRRGKQNPIR